MSGKSRVDYLVSDESKRRAKYGGFCEKLNSVFCALLGIVVLALSVCVLRHERLQIINYLDPQQPFYYLEFPSLLLGCAGATTVGSALQIISSLMLLFEDALLSTWKWLKFTSFMIYSTSTMLLFSKGVQHENVALFGAYVWLVTINCCVCAWMLICPIICCSRKGERQEARPY